MRPPGGGGAGVRERDRVKEREIKGVNESSNNVRKNNKSRLEIELPLTFDAETNSGTERRSEQLQQNRQQIFRLATKKDWRSKTKHHNYYKTNRLHMNWL